MRTAPGARKVGPDDTDELRDFRTCRIFVTGGSKRPGNSGFAPRSGPPRTHAPGAQMIWMESG
eukprot:gene9737-biopygen16739